jgi:hypothetical protein
MDMLDLIILIYITIYIKDTINAGHIMEGNLTVIKGPAILREGRYLEV